tara:strand:+ start:2246 stop:2605 length:360 start_codon:yes stop_codon:yes gene_type:complete
VAYRPITPVFKILGTAVEVNPLIPCRGIAIGGSTPAFSFGGAVGELHSSASHTTDAAEHLGDLIAAMYGLATAPTSHLVVRLSADAALTHVINLFDGVSAERHVVCVGLSFVTVVVGCK